MLRSTKPGSMASNSDYRKPRNKELHDLTWNLRYPLRVKDSKGAVLWQNRAAETLTSDLDWSEHPVSWQNKKAVLEVPSEEQRDPQTQTRLEDLEQSVERLKKHQKQTARKKRQAEAALKEREKAFESLEKRERKLQDKLEQLEARNRELRESLEASPPAPAPSALRLEEPQAAVEALREDKQALEAWVEELEQQKAGLEAQSQKQAREAAEVRAEYLEFRRRVEEEDAERLLKEQLDQKVAELEKLERTLEDEQQAFEREKRELQEKLQAQEADFADLKGGWDSRSHEQEAVAAVDLEELQEELAELRGDLQLAGRREKRLVEKVQTLEELRAEHSKVLTLLKEDLAESKAREQELKSTVKLYTDVRANMEEARTEAKALRQKIEELQNSEHKLRQELVIAREELERAGSGAPTSVASPLSGSQESLSVPVKNQLDFLKKRIEDTEKKLDQARAQLKLEQAQNQSSKESERLAFQDALTGLPNRNMIDRYLHYAHHQARSSGRSIGLFLIDIDGFRVLNNTYGREWADQLLQAVGKRLNGMRGSSHLFARHSQDRFLLLAADLEKHEAVGFVEQASRSLLEALAYPFEVEGEKVQLTGTIGASLGPLSGDHSSDLYAFAQQALDASKAAGPGKHLLFNDRIRQAMQTESVYRKQMSHAVEKDEFKAVYQPVYNLSKGRVLGLELLLRWQHRDQKILKPSEFLDAAIKSGLIFKITERVWPKAFRELARWQRQRPGLSLSINLCDRELLSPDLLEKAKKWTQQAGIEPGSIIFEVRDQSRLRMSASWWRILQEYIQAGFGLCLDDYGSDSSIFGTLAFHGFRQAKIVVDERSPRFSKAPQAGPYVQYCAKRLQTKFDKKGLAKAGFDLAQGYAVSLPLESSEVDGLLG